MATERTRKDPRIAAQAAVLKDWGQSWRRAHGASQQDLGRAAGYGSDGSPKSAAVAISRIESGKTEPTGRYRQQLLTALGRTEDDLTRAVDETLSGRQRPGVLTRAMAGPVFAENEARRAQIVAASNSLTQRVEFQARTAEQVFERARTQFVLPFLEYAVTVDWREVLDGTGSSRHPLPPTSPQRDIRRQGEQTRLSLLRAIDQSRGGASTAAGVFAAVSASSSAATGAAIASLAGASTSSATLSWLGRGSLGTAGWGVAGGTAVLTGVVALPALLALGAVLMWKGRRLRREAEAEVEKLDAAQQALEDMDQAVARAETWTVAQQEVIQRAGLIGAALQSWVIGPRPSSARPTPWSELPESTREALDVELSLVGTILDAHALPLWLGVAGVGQPDLVEDQAVTAARSEEWVRESLALATADLDADEEWLRRRMQPSPR